MTDNSAPDSDGSWESLSQDELEAMLQEAEEALREIRRELRERREQAHAGIEIDMPEHDLNEARGRWSHFVEFIRELRDQR